MTISFTCEHCRKEVKAPDDAVGRRGKCPYCGESSYIPDPEAAQEGEIPLAPVDEQEEEQLRREKEELRRQERALLAESGESESAGSGEEKRSDFRPEDLYPAVVAYCVDMTNSNLDRAQEHLRRLKPYGYTAIQAVDDFSQGRAEDETLAQIPDKLRKGFLKQLRSEIKQSVGG
jgi:hypothetical protein